MECSSQASFDVGIAFRYHCCRIAAVAKAAGLVHLTQLSQCRVTCCQAVISKPGPVLHHVVRKAQVTARMLVLKQSVRSHLEQWIKGMP